MDRHGMSKEVGVLTQLEEPPLLEDARRMIPLDEIQLKTSKLFRSSMEEAVQFNREIDETVLREMLFLSEFIKWFKNDFFRWYDSPQCERCHLKCVFKSRSTFLMEPRVDAIEYYRCPHCRNPVEFKRYNDVGMLLQTREGRCYEHSLAFALFCKSIGYDVRMVFDPSDHVWNEVYSLLQKRWVHLDPSEGVVDKPLMYEKGWNKTLSYIIAIGDHEIQEVTWRYATPESYRRTKRRPNYDRQLLNFSLHLFNNVLAKCTPARKKFLLERKTRELVELLTGPVDNDDSPYEGRISGSREWRNQRGETTNAPVPVGYTFGIYPALQQPTSSGDRSHFLYSVWYCSNKNVYYISSPSGGNLMHGWKECLYSYRNILWKQELDWKQSYLARESNNEKGLLKWHFKATDDLEIFKVEVYTKYFVCENGKVRCTVYGENNSQQYENEHKIQCDLHPCNDIFVEIELSGGAGPNAWQHAQLGRQSIDEGVKVSFGITLFLQNFAQE